MAVRGAHPKLSSHSCPDAVMTHEPFDATAARRMPLGAQGRVNPGRAVSPAMCRVDPTDLGQQGTVDRLPMALGAAAPSVIPRRRDAQHIAHGTNLEGIALIFDKTKFHLGAQLLSNLAQRPAAARSSPVAVS